MEWWCNPAFILHQPKPSIFQWFTGQKSPLANAGIKELYLACLALWCWSGKCFPEVLGHFWNQIILQPYHLMGTRCKGFLKWNPWLLWRALYWTKGKCSNAGLIHKVFLSLFVSIAEVLKYMIELRIDLNNGLKQSLAEVSNFMWGKKGG